MSRPTVRDATDGTTPGAPADLTTALAAEHAAVYAYGPVGVQLEDDDEVARARACEQAHRDRRDTLVALLSGRGAAPPGPEPSYALPFEVTGPDEARELAVLVEQRVAAAWRAALAHVADADRGVVLDALVDAALRAARWREAAGETPATVPFPGVSGLETPEQTPEDGAAE